VDEPPCSRNGGSEGSRWTRAVEAHPPVPFAVSGGRKREDARWFFRQFFYCRGVSALTFLSVVRCLHARGSPAQQATVEELTALLGKREAAIETMKVSSARRCGEGSFLSRHGWRGRCTIVVRTPCACAGSPRGRQRNL